MGDAVEKLQKELFACRSAYATAQRSVVQLSGDLKHSQQQVETLKRTLQRHQDNTAELRSCQLKMESLEGTLLSHQRETKLLQSARSVLDEEITALRTENAAKSYDIANLQQNVALQKSKIEDQASQVMVLKNQVAELEDDAAAAESDAKAARAALREASNTYNTEELSLRLDNIAKENTDLLQQLQAVKAERNQLESIQQSSPTATAESPGHSNSEAQTAGNVTAHNFIEYTASDVDRMGEIDLRMALRHCLRLQEQYKHARDSLLCANRRESLQAERLRHDVDALASSLQESESCSNAWQAQCMSALDQIERLKEMLSEGADWVEDDVEGNITAETLAAISAVNASSATSTQEAGHCSNRTVDGSGPPADQCNRCAKLQRLNLRHEEQVANLELQLRAMCAEVLRSTRMAGQTGRSTLPMLYSIESRILEMNA